MDEGNVIDVNDVSWVDGHGSDEDTKTRVKTVSRPLRRPNRKADDQPLFELPVRI